MSVGSGGGILGTSAKAAAVNQIMQETFRSRNLSVTLAKYGSTLTQTDKAALLSLTPTELDALQSINVKLAPLGISALY